MKNDQAIEDVRAVRHSISERYGHDTRKLVEHYRELEKSYKERMANKSEHLTVHRAGKQ